MYFLSDQFPKGDDVFDQIKSKNSRVLRIGDIRGVFFFMAKDIRGVDERKSYKKMKEIIFD